MEGDNLEIDGRIYKATPGLMDLITMEIPKIKDATKKTKTTIWKFLIKRARRLN